MERKLVNYIEGLFTGVPFSEQAKNIKDEITQNLLDKYEDLINSGKTKEEAYAIAISGIGDLSSIIAELKAQKPRKDPYKKEKKKCAVFNSVLWPTSVCLYLIFSLLQQTWFSSWVIFLITSVISSAYEFFTVKSNLKVRKASLNSIVWLSATSLYFIFSFSTHRWDMTWILFILAIPMNRIAHLFVFKDDYIDDDDNDD